MTKIANKQQEIMDLIGRVVSIRDGSQDRVDPGQIAKRQQHLAKIKERRGKLERQLGGEQLLELHRMLEQRVNSLESTIQQNKALPPAKHEPEAASLQRHEDCVLSGAIREGLLADIFQMISSNMMTGTFGVVVEDTEIQLFFIEGEVCHGLGPELEGESAFFAAMAIEDGRFYFEETVVELETRTIKSKTQFLILEALRQIDESRA
jgi:hypothetical protein